MNAESRQIAQCESPVVNQWNYRYGQNMMSTRMMRLKEPPPKRSCSGPLCKHAVSTWDSNRLLGKVEKVMARELSQSIRKQTEKGEPAMAHAPKQREATPCPPFDI
jgi:hypothetical protein